MSITDELRGFANSGMSAMECSAYSDKLIDIADRIDKTHEEELAKLKAENTKLREEFDKMDVWHSKELTAAMDENAKLRELSSIMLKCIMANERKKLICWECPMHKQFDELRSYCCLEHEAKKLGIGENE